MPSVCKINDTVCFLKICFGPLSSASHTKNVYNAFLVCQDKNDNNYESLEIMVSWIVSSNQGYKISC